MTLNTATGSVTLPTPDSHAADSETMFMLYGLVRYLKPSLIIEAGTYMGHAACTMACALRDAEVDGEIWTADVKDYGAQANVDQNDLSAFVHVFQGDFGAMLAGPLKDRKARLAFIDSGLVVDPQPMPVMTNLRHTHVQLALGHMVSGGVMVIDDCAGTWDGVEEIRQLGLYLFKGRGMAIVQRG